MKYGKQSLFETNDFYTIGDIHGAGDHLENLISKIEKNTKNPFIVFVGDLLGLGGQNLKVLEIITQLKIKYPNRVFVIEGNHDKGFKDFINFGDYEFLIKKMPDFISIHQQGPSELKEFLDKKNVLKIFEELIPYFETKKALITHAPIVSSIWGIYGGFHYEEEYDTEEISLYGNILEKMKWELQTSFEFPEGNPIPGLNKFLICGHQHLVHPPHRTVHKAPRVFKHRAYLDCGCGYKNDRNLFAIHYPSKKIVSSK